ncbi:MAG: hypothetical protein PHP88_00675 [bacterium]|nr:hypothetical protein [bacterium]
MQSKNIRIIPSAVRTRLAEIPNQYIIAAVSRTYSTDDLQNGYLKHLNISLTSEGLSIPRSIIPSPTSGRFSRMNIDGHEIVRKDLPKEKLYHSVDAPNWGDSSRGYHTIDLPYERYPREFIAPKLVQIEMECPVSDPSASKYLIFFKLSEVIDRKKINFEDDLLRCLNLLQENIGVCSVARAGSTLADHIQTLNVDWELLPPGTADEAVARLFKDREPSEKEKRAVQERYKFLMSLTPKKLIYGQSGFLRYFGAMIEDDLVVFDNIEYGNAIYIMFEDWRDLSKRSRIELMSGVCGAGFERVVHTSGWKMRTKEIIKKKTQH